MSTPVRSACKDSIVDLSNTQSKLLNSQKKGQPSDRFLTQLQDLRVKLDFSENNKSLLTKQPPSQSSLKKETYQNVLKGSLSKNQPKRKAYGSKIAREGYMGWLDEMCTNVTQLKSRQVPKTPYKILEAPKLKDDFYTNLLDWSSDDVISVVLDNAAYIWPAKSSEAIKLIDGYISSICWGQGLIIGEETGRVRIIDVEKKKESLRFKQHIGRVGIIDKPQGSHLIATGSKDTNICTWDCRQKSAVSTFEGHSQEICGLKWSHDSNFLVSGGNDNTVNVWDIRADRNYGKITAHSAAVKAIAWSPHRNSVFATGGGSTDKTIKLWNVHELSCISSTDTGSQVCNMMFSKLTNELVSTHGYSLNSIAVWNLQGMEKIATLNGHSYRVLYLASSPDHQTIVSGSGDQTLRFWKLFPSTKSSAQNGSRLSQENFNFR